MSATIREARLALGLTQEDLASRAGVSISMLRLLDRGTEPKRSLAADKVWAAIARAERARRRKEARS